MTRLLRDARFGWRLLRKKPGFTVVAVVTLALGIASNTAIFSVIYATYLAPLPYRDADKLVMVFSRLDGNRHLADAGDFVEWKRRATVFEDLNAWTLKSVNLAAGDRPEHVEAVLATPGLLAMIGQERPLAHAKAASRSRELGLAGSRQLADELLPLFGLTRWNRKRHRQHRHQILLVGCRTRHGPRRLLKNRRRRLSHPADPTKCPINKLGHMLVLSRSSGNVETQIEASRELSVSTDGV